MSKAQESPRHCAMEKREVDVWSGDGGQRGGAAGDEEEMRPALHLPPIATVPSSLLSPPIS
eukprot:1371076-Rhodomonas_salina.1